MSLFTFFGNHKRDAKAEEAVDKAIEQELEEVEKVSTKPFIKPQRLATIIEIQEVEHFEQPPNDEEHDQTS